MKIPTGIDSFDPILDGGLPVGSLVLLIGETGAGHFEFVISSLVSHLKNGKTKNNVPVKICYVTFTRSKDDIIKEIAFSFPEYLKILQDGMDRGRIEFKDFSEIYFSRSFIPYKWMSGEVFSFETLRWKEEEKNLIESLIEYLDDYSNKSIVIIDSLTALAQHCLVHMKWSDYVLFLYGLQKASKKWEGIVYATMTKGVFDGNKQEEILECVDGAIFFEWENLGVSQKKRIMYMKKFRGVLPGLDQNNIVNFEIQITSKKGFEVSNIKRVRGR